MAKLTWRVPAYQWEAVRDLLEAARQATLQHDHARIRECVERIRAHPTFPRGFRPNTDSIELERIKPVISMSPAAEAAARGQLWRLS